MFDFVTLALSRRQIIGPVRIKAVGVFAQLYTMLRDKYVNITESILSGRLLSWLASRSET